MTFNAASFDPSKYSIEESLYAALALDSYSRGYGAKLHQVGDATDYLVADAGQQIGVAEVIFDSRVLGDASPGIGLDASVGFYAVAYQVGSEVVISYRGSDQLGLFSSWDDYGTVTNIKAGNVDDHILLALKFFNAVEDEIASNPFLNGLPIVTVGHSLGGAIAGVVASLKGTAGMMFDNTGFEDAAKEAIDRATDYHGVDYLLETLIFRGLTPWTVAEASSLKTVSLRHDVAHLFRGYDQETLEDTPYDLGNYPLNVWDFASAHVQALLVYRLALEEKYGPNTNWGYAAKSVFSALMSEALASAIGIEPSEFDNAASGVMKDMISQTVIGGEFGDSALDVMMTDMNTFGKAVDAGVQVADEAGYYVARYAAGLAVTAATNQANGILSYDAGRGVLTADLSYTKWAQVDDDRLDIPKHDFTWLMADGHLSASDMALLMQGPGRYDSLVYASEVTDLHLPTLSSGGATKFVAGLGVQSVIGTNASEYFDLGSGDDTVVTNAGIDWIYGGLGIDTLKSTLAWSDFSIQYHGDTLVLAKRGQTSTPTIFLTDSVEKFILDDVEFAVGNILNVAPVGSEFTSGALHLERVITAGDEVARLGGIDVHPDVFKWTLHEDSLDYFYLDGNIVRARNDIVFDYEDYIGMLGAPIMDLTNGVSQQTWWQQISEFMNSFYVVKAVVSDSYGLTAATNLVIAVSNANEAPLDLMIDNLIGTVSGTSVTIDENLAIGTLIGTAMASDPDGDQVIWSLIDGNGKFRIDPVTGEIFVDGHLDFEAEPSFDLQVRARDAGGAYTDRFFNIVLEDKNDAPHAFGFDVMDVGQTLPIGSVVAYLTDVADDDGDDAEHFAGVGPGPRFVIVSDPSNLFEIVGNEIRTKGLLAAQAYTLQVAAVDSHGALSFPVAISMVVSASSPIASLPPTSGDDTLFGTGLEDVIYGGGGGDTIFGFDLRDFLYGEGGDDILYGGGGDDILVGGSGNNDLYGGDGDDLFFGGNGNDRMFGGSGNDTFQVHDGINYVNGGSGSDLIEFYGNGIFRVYSGADTDTDIINIVGSGIYDVYVDGYDVVDSSQSGATLRVYVGTGGNDAIWAGSGSTTVFGQRGYFYLNQFEGGSTKVYSGAAGSHLNLSGPSILWGGSGVDSVTANGGGDFRLGGGNDVISLGAAARVWDGAGDDLVTGSQYNDTFYMGAGDDLIRGNGGVDYAVYDSSFSSFTFAETAHGHFLEVISSSGTDTLIDVDFVKFSDAVWSYSNLISMVQNPEEWSL